MRSNGVSFVFVTKVTEREFSPESECERQWG